MVSKKLMIIAASIAAIITLSLVTIAFENHVRWNPNLDECVYYFSEGDSGSMSCYVPELNCMKDGRDEYKDVDKTTCYYTPRKEQTSSGTSDCAEFVEGDLIVLKYNGSDPDTPVGPAGELRYTFGKPFDENQEWQTARGDAGRYTVDVTVSDGEYEDKDQVCFIVLPGNHAPVLTASDASVDEGSTLTLKPTCTDEDGDAVRITYSGDMESNTWTPGYDDAGEYSVTIVCTDTEGAFDKKTLTVKVNDVNRAPTVSIADVTVGEGETVHLKPDCVDPEGTETNITYSGDMDTNTWKTGYDDAGEYDVTVTCKDADGLADSKNVKVTVENRNRPPSITAMVVLG